MPASALQPRTLSPATSGDPAAHTRRTLVSLMESLVAQAHEHTWESLREAGYADITPSHFVVLRYLWRRPGARISEMADAAGMAKQSIGYLVDYLEARGYVTRSPDPADRRAQIIALSAPGQAAMAVAHNRLQSDEAELARRFGGERMESVRDILAAIAPPAFWEDGAALGVNVHPRGAAEPR